jgi:methionyl-tRNA formyltransferase
MRVALFASGSPLSVRALQALAARFDVAAVVAPVPRAAGLRGWARRWRGRRVRRALAAAAREAGAPLVLYAPGRADGVRAALQASAPDLVCVATFPYLLPPALLAVAPRGAIGLHPSLLPRHRGPDPLFWTYHAGDVETGVSVLWLDAGEDTGPLLAQERVPLPRGRPLAATYDELARRGAALLAESAAAVEAGTAARRPQDEALATREPRPRPHTCAVPLASSGAEWLWHFLAGLGPHRPFVVDGGGRPVLHGRVLGFTVAPHARAGDVEKTAQGLRLFCRDGWVDVARPALFERLRRAVRRSARP